MHVEIDFEVFKALTALRESESDSYNAVIRRLLGLPGQINALAAMAEGMPQGALGALGEGQTTKVRGGLFGSISNRNALAPDTYQGGTLAKLLGGVWYNNVHFPEGTRFRANYKGQTFHAEIRNGQWVGEDGVARKSPSDAASAISKTNVNGWRFWFVRMPDDPSWRKLNELRQ